MRITETFDSLTALVDRAQEAQPIGRMRSSQDNSRPDMFGKETFRGAARLVRNGWPEGRARLAMLLDAARSSTQSVAMRAAVLDVGGAYPSVPLAVAGDPACMIDFRSDEYAHRAPVVSIAYNISVSVAIDARTVAGRGAAVLAEVEALEAAGIRCEITVAAFVTGGSEFHAVNCVVKAPDQPLDLDRMAFVMLHPGMNRRFVWALREMHRWQDANMNGYGMPTDWTAQQRAAFDVYVPALAGTAESAASSGWTDPATAATKARTMFDGIWTAYTDAA